MNSKTLAEIQNRPERQSELPLSRQQLDALIATSGPDDLISALFGPACEKVNFSPDTMTDGDIVVYTVWTFLGETCNGGFIQYLTNQSGQWAHYCGKSLRCIGAIEYAKLIEDCISSFTSKETPEEWEEDLDVYWDKNPDEPFEAIEKGFWDRFRKDEDELTLILAEYIKSHPDLFAPV